MATPLTKIVTSDIGRGAQLKYGPGNNQYARASDVNPIIDYVNSHDSGTIGTSSGSNTPTINAYVGRVTTASLTTAGGYATTTITITNSLVSASNRVDVQLESYAGTLVTQGIPMIYRAVCSAGTITVVIVNMHPTAGNALAAAVTFNFKVS